MEAIKAGIGAVGGWIAAIIAGSVTLTLWFIIWKSGAIPALIGLGQSFIDLAREGIGGFFGYLRALVEAF